MSNFRFTTKKAVYGQIFLKFPVTLIRGSKYTKMSAKAKVAYMVLLDRLQYSIKNNWVDSHDNVYFVFTLAELSKLLNCSQQTVVKVKHELESFGLLLQKQVGLNQPNRLYLAELEINPEDAYILDEEAETRSNAGLQKIGSPENAVNSGLQKIGSPVVSKGQDPQSPVSTGLQKIGSNLELDYSRDLTRDLSETANVDSSATESSTPEQKAEQSQPGQTDLSPERDMTLERLLLDNFADSTDPAVSGDILSRNSLQLIGKWSHTVSEAKERVGIVLNAKRDAELEWDTYLLTEDLQDELDRALLRVVMRWKDQLDGRSAHTIRNINNYLYGAMKQVFENASLAQLTSQAKTEEQRAALHDLQEKFEDPATGKRARQIARQKNFIKRQQLQKAAETNNQNK